MVNVNYVYKDPESQQYSLADASQSQGIYYLCWSLQSNPLGLGFQALCLHFKMFLLSGSREQMPHLRNWKVKYW